MTLTRYPIVTLRGEARNIGDASRFDRDTLAPNVPAAFQQKGILFTDLKFDAQVCLLSRFEIPVANHSFLEDGQKNGRGIRTS